MLYVIFESKVSTFLWTFTPQIDTENINMSKLFVMQRKKKNTLKIFEFFCIFIVSYIFECIFIWNGLIKARLKAPTQSFCSLGKYKCVKHEIYYLKL